MHILIADDEQRIRDVVRTYAEHEGYQVSEAKDGKEAVELCRRHKFDAVILDIMMPQMDGFTACREIQKIRYVPILMLSARGEECDKLLGFELGIDDYVVKPFSPRELMARLRVMIQRNSRNKHKMETKLLRFEGLEIDLLGHRVTVDGEVKKLTPKEFELLCYLVAHQNVAISRKTLMEEVWGYEFFGDDRTVDAHIKMLRASLGEYRKFIVTLRGMGYKFEV